MWDSEILISTLFNELGYLSPRTTKVKLQYNDQTSNFIFQEKASKEFLEANFLKTTENKKSIINAAIKEKITMIAGNC